MPCSRMTSSYLANRKMKKFFVLALSAPILLSTCISVAFAADAYVDLRASASVIRRGENVTLSWFSSPDVVSCFAGGGWSGTKPTRGSQVVAPSANTTYSLSCNTLSGDPVAKSVSVTLSAGGGAGGTDPLPEDGIDPIPEDGTDPIPEDGTDPVTVGIKLENPLKAEYGNSLQDLLKGIVNEILLPLGGILAVLAFIYSGFLYVTAQGDETKIKKAHKALLYTAIGTAVLLGAWMISTVIANTINAIRG